MTLPVRPTLSELKRSVIVRSGLADMSDINARYNDLLTELLNRAQTELILNASWARSRILTSFASTQDVTDYDIPSDCAIGDIIRLSIQDLNSIQTDLVYDDLSDFERFLTADATKPQYYRIIDTGTGSIIRVLPKVDATNYPTFIMEYYSFGSPLVNDTDRAQVDGEALKQYATILFKRHLGTFKDSVDKDFADMQMYLMRLRGKESPARNFSIASRQYSGPIYATVMRNYPTGYGTGPYWEGWSPW